MSIAESSNLNRLLRLLTDVAPAAEVQQLRASMREDEILKQQHDRLLQVMTRPFSLENSLLHLDQVDPEDVAAFIDGTLTQSEQVAFEKQCWNSDSLLGEVVAGWRLQNDPQAHESQAVGAVSPTQSRYAGVDRGMSGDPQVGGKSSEQLTPPCDHVPQIEAVSLHRQKVKRGTRGAYRGAMLALVTAAIIVAVLVGAWKWIAPAGNLPREIDPERIVQQEKEAEGSSQQDVVQNDAEDGSPLDQPSPPGAGPEIPRPKVPPPEITPPSNGLVEGPDVEPMRPDESQRPQGPGILLPPSQPRINLAKWLDWSDVQGIAATKDAAGEQWRGINVPKSYAQDDAIPWVQVATFSDSQLKGEDVPGAKWIADANTSFRISQRADSSKGVVVFDLVSGRLAIENLASGRTLYLKVNQQEYQLVVDKADTTLVVQHLGRDTLFGVFQGGVTYDGNVMDRGSWRAVDMTGKVASFKKKGETGWFKKDVVNDFPATLRDKLNNAPNFLAQVIDASRNGTQTEQEIAARAMLCVSAADNEAPSDGALRKMMASQHEEIRAALVEWIAAQCLENPRFGMMMVQRVARLQTVPANQVKSLQDWFAAYARGTQFNSTLLNQMTGSLTTQSKPVVRQAAKFFLEQYLGRTIPYNPVKPGGSITRVITEVRKMVAEKQRRSAR